jgi:hypothetical protein
MNKSETIGALAAALAKAQGQMAGAMKDSTNPHFKSKYADLASIVEAIKAPLSNNGIAYVQTVVEHESAAGIETILMHSSGEWMSTGPCFVPVAKTDAQGYGSAMTYARRYSLAAACGCAPEDDDGNAAAKAAPKSRVLVAAEAAADKGIEAYKAWWTNAGAQDRQTLGADTHDKLKERAAKASGGLAAFKNAAASDSGKREPQADESPSGQSDVVAPTYASVMAALNDAQSPEALDAAADLIRSVPDKKHRDELAATYKAMRSPV